MSIRPCAEFRTDIPSDMVEDEHDIVQFGGRAVAMAVGEMFAGLGYKVEEPSYEGEHGWDLRVQRGDFCLWLEFTEIEEMILQTKDVTPRSKRSAKAYGDALIELNEALSSDPRFHDVLWYSQVALTSGQGGSSSPVGPDDEPARPAAGRRGPETTGPMSVSGDGGGEPAKAPRIPVWVYLLLAFIAASLALSKMIGRHPYPTPAQTGGAAATAAPTGPR